jgi:predicted nucleotidyltransferase
MLDLPGLRTSIGGLDFDPLFVTVSGAHLHGFPSRDSDVDLRGCHEATIEKVVGLHGPDETRQTALDLAGVEVEYVSHEVSKYLKLLLKNNGYILEQIFSPLVVAGEPFLGKLRPLATRCITRHHYHHYRGFLNRQRRFIAQEQPIRAKTILYAYRVAMTGIHLLRSGDIEANLLRLNEIFRLPSIDDLIAAKVSEQASVAIDRGFHEAELHRLDAMMEAAYRASALPDDRPHEEVNRFLVQLRLRSFSQAQPS